LTDPSGETPVAACAFPPIGSVCVQIGAAAWAGAAAAVCLLFCAEKPSPAPVQGPVGIFDVPIPNVSPNVIPGPQVTPLPGETIEEFTERVTQACKQSCIDQVVDEVDGIPPSPGDELPPVGGEMGEKIRRCTMDCVDQAFEDVNEDDFD